MGFFKKLSGLFSAAPPSDSSGYWIAVKCQRCGEVIRTRVNLNNDLSIDYDQGGQPVYYCHKMLMGESGRCFQRVEVDLTFDASRKLINRQVSGGEFEEEAK